ncbi:MAG: FkbM family methyltransferase [Satyrvirus sp.]|uniref:FkbM family methyltransferase n=1 Tax=Satyrvirus sp. TaxID=2487771 RepID=A0A3G5ADD6_9VIRU|nr:MAG: FkbM family methyltransferase [Satyrvirus sp.]
MQEFVKGKNILIIGSVIPWYEAMSLNYGCKSCTIVEYQQRHTTCPDLRYITVGKFQEELEQGIKYDVVVSISSLEHDGLGRYGDPLNPNADIEDMQKTLSYLVSGGILILSIPVGKDKVVWNAHRIYGHVRLPLILVDGFKIQKLYGLKNLNDPLIDKDTGVNGSFQPVFILKKDN